MFWNYFGSKKIGLSIENYGGPRGPKKKNEAEVKNCKAKAKKKKKEKN